MIRLAAALLMLFAAPPAFAQPAIDVAVKLARWQLEARRDPAFLQSAGGETRDQNPGNRRRSGSA